MWHLTALCLAFWLAAGVLVAAPSPQPKAVPRMAWKKAPPYPGFRFFSWNYHLVVREVYDDGSFRFESQTNPDAVFYGTGGYNRMTRAELLRLLAECPQH